MIWVIIFLLSINLYLLLYVRWLLKNLNFVTDNVGDIQHILGGFKQHVEALHETEMFYGDETLQSLIKHSRVVVEELDKYESVLKHEEFEEEEEI